MKLKSLIQRLDVHLLEIFLGKFRYQPLWVRQGVTQRRYTVVREEQDPDQFSLRDLHWDKAEGWEMDWRILPTVSERSNKFPDRTQPEQRVLIPLQQKRIKPGPPVRVSLCP